MNTESTSTETTANGHTPKLSRSVSRRLAAQTEAVAYVPGQVQAARQAALAERASLLSKLAKVNKDLGEEETIETVSSRLPVYVPVEAETAPKPPVKARARKPAPAAAAADASPATPRAKRGSRIEAAKLAVEDIVGKLRSSDKALSSEELQELTGIDSAVIGLALKRGVDDGTFGREGSKRSAKYTLKADAP